MAPTGWSRTSGEDVFFRGQPSTEYGLSSSLYRVCRARPAAPEAGIPNQVDEHVMAGTERAVIDAMRREGIGRGWRTASSLPSCSTTAFPPGSSTSPSPCAVSPLLR